MRLSQKRVFGLLLLIAVGFQAFSQEQRARTPLPRAVANGQARVSIHGTGGSSGDSIKIDIAKGPKAGNEPLEVSVPPGTVLTNGNAAGQDMVIAGVTGLATSEDTYTPMNYIRVEGSQPVTYVLNAFCMNFEKDNPSENDTFTVGEPDPALACILKNSRKLSVPARQAAIWIYTDNVSYEHMNQKFQVSQEEYTQGQQVVEGCRSNGT